MSALLHALAALQPSAVGNDCSVSSDETALSITANGMHHGNAKRVVSEAIFQKHIYSRQRKHKLKPLEDFDPRPSELRGNARENLKTFLSKVHGQSLGVSLLFDENSRCWLSKLEKPYCHLKKSYRVELLNLRKVCVCQLIN